MIPYYGSKATLAPWLIENSPPHRVYAEPFGGSVRLLLAKQRSAVEVISDIDPHLINFFAQVRDNWRVLQAICQHDFREDFYLFAFANRKAPIVDPLESARFFYSSRLQSFKHRVHTACWDQTKRGTFHCGLKKLPVLAERLSGVTIRHLDYRTAMLLYDAPDVFFYLDPPYPGSVLMHANPYDYNMMDDQDHLTLLRLIRGLKGRVMISGYDSPLYRRELRDWSPKHKKTKSRVAMQSFREDRTEFIWMNY